MAGIGEYDETQRLLGWCRFEGDRGVKEFQLGKDLVSENEMLNSERANILWKVTSCIYDLRESAMTKEVQ